MLGLWPFAARPEGARHGAQEPLRLEAATKAAAAPRSHRRIISLASATTTDPHEELWSPSLACSDDEALQEIAPPVRRTFIDFASPRQLRRTESAPARLAAAPKPKAVPPPVPSIRHRRRPQVPWASVGSPELPTVGSAGHHRRKCKPCAFVWKENGCTNGAQCQFCHLCDEEEKKRRRKQKQETRRARKQA